jgi:hypothetical protein
MFDKIEYKLLISNYMTKEEYKKLIEKYMDKFNISYANAKQFILYKQIQKYEEDFDIQYEKAFINTYKDLIENGYNISLL